MPSSVGVGGGPPDGDDPISKTQSWLAHFRMFGLPDFAKREMEEEARTIYRLDADLAANRSFSLIAKFRIQGERNLAKSMAATEYRAQDRIARKLFQKAHGYSVY